ncbi:MAG: Helix-turn-helix domain [Alphaproteobacteria bacterium]|nr:Helix-turn-helix domain [Alphaproteobacteria bacterium]
MRQPRSTCQDKAGPSGPQAATQGPYSAPNLNPRHTTNPPDSCLSRSFMIGDVSEGWGGPKEALAAPPGGRLWHGFAVRRPPVGRGGRGLTFVLIGGGGSAWPSRPMQTPPSLDIGGMERKPAPVAFFTERSLASFLAVSDRTIRNWIRRGELPSYKLGASRRIDPADVEDFLARHRDEAA